MSTRYLIRFDDIAPGMAWSRFERFDRLARDLGLPFLVGVVPDCKDPSLSVEPERADFWPWLRDRAARGWTVAQHGHTHVYETDERGLLGIGRKSEFAGLPYAVQYDKLAAGKAILEREGLWQGVFMAPSHSFDRATLKALKVLGFTAITDGYGFYAYDFEGLAAVPQLLSRPMGLGFGVETVCLHVNTMGDGAIDQSLAFIRANRAAIIGFREALTIVPPIGLVGDLMRVASEAVLRGKRLARG